MDVSRSSVTRRPARSSASAERTSRVRRPTRAPTLQAARSSSPSSTPERRITLARCDQGLFDDCSGGAGIRTQGRVTPSAVFKTAPFGRSGTPPRAHSSRCVTPPSDQSLGSPVDRTHDLALRGSGSRGSSWSATAASVCIRDRLRPRHLVTRAGAPKRCSTSGTSPPKFSRIASAQRSVTAVPFNVCGVTSCFSPTRKRMPERRA